MRYYKYKNKLTKREAFYTNIKLLLKNEPIQLAKRKFLNYHTLYLKLRTKGKYEDENVIVNEITINSGNTK